MICTSNLTRADNIQWMFDDFRASAIPDQLIEANVRWAEGDEVIEILTAEKITQIQKVTSYITTGTRKLLDKYEQVAADGGWLAYGCDLEGQEQGAIAYFKPRTPRLELENGKLKKIKYETPGGMRAAPILPWVDDETAAAIYLKYGVKPLEGETFWRVVWRCNLPVSITEGLKKALALIARGYPAIALRGVTCWHLKGSRELHPEIQHFATADRKICIIFDQDEKLSTKINVGGEIKKLGEELEKLSCKVFVPVWDGKLGKGIDDAISALSRQGEDAQSWLDELISDSQSLKDLKRLRQIAAALNEIKRLNSLSYPVEQLTEGEYLPDLPPLEKGAIHVLDASMNAGKTTRIGRDWVKEVKAKGWNVLVLTPLNSLGEQTAGDWGLPHIHHFGTSAEQQQALWSQVSAAHGIVLCPDSLHRLPSWFFERPLLLILDEANQVDDHICEGNTLRSRLALILEKLTAIATHAATTGAIVLSEAGIPDRAVNFIKEIAGCEKVRVFRHRKQSKPWDCTVFRGQMNQASGFRARLLEAVSKGRRLLIVTSSQREAKRMERAIARKIPTVKVIRIDSETNQQGQFRGFYESPDTWLQTHQPDVLILSPSAKSGVSIQGGVPVEDAYFDSVWGYFPTLATDTHMQLLGRFRPPVPRFIFIPEFILTSGDESLWCPQAIKRRLRMNAQYAVGVYGLEELFNLTDERAEVAVRIESAVLDYLAISRQVSGSQKRIACHALVQKLESAGYFVQCVEMEKDKATAELWKEIQEEIWREEAEAIATCKVDPKIHTVEWAHKKLDSLECSYEDRLLAHKVLWRDEFPGILFDDAEECYQALCHDYGAMRRGVLLQAKAENLEAAQEDEREATEAIFRSSIRAFHRLPRESIKARLIAETGVLALLDGTPYSNSDPRAIAIKKQALRYAVEIYYHLRLQINHEQTPVEIAHKLLKKLNIQKSKEDRPGEIEVIGRPGRRCESRDNLYRVDLSSNLIRARLLEAARRKLSEAVSSTCRSSESIPLQIDDTAKNNERLPHLTKLVGAVVIRAGSLGRWVIQAIANNHAKLNPLDGWGFAPEVPLDELTLLEQAIA